jgi:transglutaminase-like putative cysteine protease
MTFKKYLTESVILDFSNDAIQALIRSRGWEKMDEFDQIGAAYDFVRNEIKFGYNHADNLPASKVLRDKYGQCNTKGNLLMALLRALDIPCRFHGFTIDNQLQKGAIPNYLFWLAPKHILHSWVEVIFEGDWINLEGFILDEPYLTSIQDRQSHNCGAYKGYAIATPCLQKPEVDWVGKSTYIQREGIHDDFGVFDTPDAFYSAHGTNLKGLKRILFQNMFRHMMNRNLDKIRNETRA